MCVNMQCSFVFSALSNRSIQASNIYVNESVIYINLFHIYFSLLVGWEPTDGSSLITTIILVNARYRYDSMAL